MNNDTDKYYNYTLFNNVADINVTAFGNWYNLIDCDTFKSYIPSINVP